MTQGGATIPLVLRVAGDICAGEKLKFRPLPPGDASGPVRCGRCVQMKQWRRRLVLSLSPMGIVFMLSYLWARLFSSVRPILASVRQFAYGSSSDTVIFGLEIVRACVCMCVCECVRPPRYV